MGNLFLSHGARSGIHSEVYLVFLALLLLTSFTLTSNICEGEARAEDSGSSSGTPIIHSLLLNGKDSGQLHAHPFEKVNISAVISNADSASVKVMFNDELVMAPSGMRSKETIFWSELEIPVDFNDYYEYQLVVKAENSNGSEELACGRSLRVDHLFVESVVFPGIVVDPYNLTLTARTWDNRSVGTGRSSVTMVRYYSADNFSSSYLGEREIGEFSSVRYSGNSSFENISILKFDVDVVDEERGYLGRTTNYALGVPFPINVSCDKTIESVRGHLLCGPFAPGEGIAVEIATAETVENVTLEIYESLQFQELLLGSEEPLYAQNIMLTGGHGEDVIPAPDVNGSYLMLARGREKGDEGNESLGFFMFQVQEFATEVQTPQASKRSEDVVIELRPEMYINDAEMMVTIANDEGVILARDSQAVREGDSYLLRFTVPLYAANGSYYVVAYYRGEDAFGAYSVGVGSFNVTGGPTTPAPGEQPPEHSSTGDAFLHLWTLAYLLLIVGLVLVLAGTILVSKRRALLDLDKVDRGVSEHLEKKAEDGKKTHPHREQEQGENKGK